MPNILLEYKGIPFLLNYNLSKLSKISFITVYTIGENDYNRREFKNIESAIDFNLENLKLKLTFILLESELEEDGTLYVEYKYVELQNNRLKLSSTINLINKQYSYYIYFSLESFRVYKTNNSPKLFREYEIRLIRRKTSKVDSKYRHELLDSYYELIPRFEDIFLESLFMLDVMSSNDFISDQQELKAYFLQAKIRIEGSEKTENENYPKASGNSGITSIEDLEISNLIGLDKIKLEIQELRALAQFRKKRIDLGLPVTPSTLHLVFTGNPGTGKTTVARMLGKIYYDMSLLASSKVVEVSRGDMVGQYVGHTSPKTQKVFESALGGILFIDEAYSLFRRGAGNDFGKEALETLLKLMEDNRENIVVIIAGYPKEMEELLTSNPGLKSRFSKTLHFQDYSKDELIQIFHKLVADYQNTLSDGAKYKIEYLIESYYDGGQFTSNARAIRNIFEETIKRQSHRLSNKVDLTQNELTIFIDKDIPDKLE